MDRINNKLYQANINLLDTNKLLENKIARLESIIEELSNYVDRMSYQEIVNNPKKDLQKILKKEN